VATGMPYQYATCNVTVMHLRRVQLGLEGT